MIIIIMIIIIIIISYHIISYHIISYYYIIISDCGQKQFKCSDGKCIPTSFECNGREDCADGIDEIKNCGMNSMMLTFKII